MPYSALGCEKPFLCSSGYFVSPYIRCYNPATIAKLPKELVAALHATGESELEVVDPDTQRTYFVVDSDTHRQAMEALRRQQDRDAIAQGIADMEAGLGIPIEEARALTRERILARKP